MRFGGLIIAIVLAAVAAIIVLRSSSNSPAPQAGQPVSEAVKSVDIFVAAKPIPVGTKITADMIAVQPWPEHLVLSGFVRADKGGNTILGTVARGTFQAQEPIMQSRISNANDPSFLAGELPKGMRIVAIATNEVEGVAGFVSPGDRVDVILTHEIEQKKSTPNGSNGQMQDETDKLNITETLLTNVKVVAVDQRASNEGATDRDGKLIIPKSVSLMVSLADAQRLRLGAKEGTLTLTLRSIQDQDSADALSVTRPTDISQVQTESADQPTDTVRVLRGAPTENKEVSNDVGVQRAAPNTLKEGASSAAPVLGTEMKR